MVEVRVCVLGGRTGVCEGQEFMENRSLRRSLRRTGVCRIGVCILGAKTSGSLAHTTSL